MRHFGISVGGEKRLRKAIEAELRHEYEKELAATDYGRRQAIEEKIKQEAEERLRRVASPFSLWSSLRPGS
jgi:hypothetical protein